MREASNAKLSILGSKALDAIPSDPFVTNSVGADEGSAFSLKLRSVVLTAEADSSSSSLIARESLRMYVIRT